MSSYGYQHLSKKDFCWIVPNLFQIFGSYFKHYISEHEIDV
jgi:hypothetical protein